MCPFSSSVLDLNVNIIEKACVTIRHSPGLARTDWLWNAARPVYDAAMNKLGRHGLERVVNGTDRILIDPKYRGLGEVYEPEVWRHLMSNVRAGDVVADVGAHIGLYTLALAKRVGPSGRVVAFEPDEKSFRDLLRHVELNGLQAVVRAVRAAVGTLDGEIGFTSDQDTQNRILVEKTHQSSTVPAVRLDSFFKGQRLDILKVDVEGFEENVLKGGLDVPMESPQAPRLIYLEVHPYNWSSYGTTSKSFLRQLREAGYVVETLDGQPCRSISKYGEVIARRANV